MLTLKTRNVNSAYERLLKLVTEEGVYVGTRNGNALSIPHPVLVQFTHPMERVLFDTKRRANPFFHLVEALWMLSGRNDTQFISQFNKQMNQYSDNGVTFNAAYGDRWRHHFGYDQITRACDMLTKNPEDRRAVISMWDGYNDLGSGSKDLPCNTQIMLRVVNGELDMTITNRSNDLIFGLCGANAVHMSVLHEYMANRIGVAVGSWWHLTNNLHVYSRHYDLLESGKAESDWDWNVYPARSPLVTCATNFYIDCLDMCSGRTDGFLEPFFRGTVSPMIHAWKEYKSGDHEYAYEWAQHVESEDWSLAAIAWITSSLEIKNGNAQNVS